MLRVRWQLNDTLDVVPVLLSLRGRQKTSWTYIFMRWMWIDRFIEFQRGQRAMSVKNISLAEEQLDGYFPGFPLMPASLIVEGLAQTGGLLVAETSGFEQRVVLAKLGKAQFRRLAVPGDTLTYTVVVEDIRQDGAIVKGTSHCGEHLQAEVELVFAYLDDRFQGVDLFEPAELLCTLRLLGVYDVGRDKDGRPLEIPQRLLAAEQASQSVAAGPK